MADIELRDVPLQPTAVLKVTTPTANISEAMGQAFERLYASLGQAGVTPAGPPFSKYTEYSEEHVTFEAGTPVAAPFAGAGEVVASEVGGCRAAVTTHLGPYDTIGQTYGRLQAWIEAQGRKPSTVMWETYLNDPADTEPANLRTEVFWPLEEA